jgi:hypothetical protein
MSDLDKLTEINLSDLVSSFGCEDTSFLLVCLRFIFRPTARKFAQMMLEFNTNVANEGLGYASVTLLKKFAHSVTVYGKENIPVAGPVLVLSNHPGMVDTLALFATLQRTDLRIIANRRPFLEALTNVLPALEFVAKEPGEMITFLKNIRKHLTNGGALLTFPAGKIDPDPQVYPGAVEALEDWSDSAGLFLRFSSEAVLLPVVVSSVIWEKTADAGFLKRIKPDREKREKLAVAIQLVAHVAFRSRPLHVKLQIGAPIAFPQDDTKDKTEVHQSLLNSIRSLLAHTPEGQGDRIF